MDIQVVCLAMICLLAGCRAVEKKTNAEGVYVEVVGMSGKIKVATQENINADENRVMVDFDSLTEFAADKTTATSNKHKVNTFANVDFTFTDPTDGEYQNLTTTSFTFTASNILAQSAGSPSMKVEVMIFKEEGTITVDDEDTEVKKGTMKFNVVIENWEWCTAQSIQSEGCGSNVGQNLELVIKLQSKKKPTKETSDSSTEGDSFDVGDDVKFILSKKIDVDGTFHDMATGYPKLEEMGQNTLFKFMFPKGAKIVYDPTTQFGSGGVARLSIGFSSVLLVALAVLFCSL